MAVKLTTYDPAEDLTSDAAMATFMAEAFATEDSQDLRLRKRLLQPPDRLLVAVLQHSQNRVVGIILRLEGLEVNVPEERSQLAGDHDATGT